MLREAVSSLMLAGPVLALAHSPGLDGRAIQFPDVPGRQTLICDLHMHTVFSDGSVWPDIRVEEAVRDELDCIATTEHLEYQPHLDDIPHKDRNRAFEIASSAVGDGDLIVLPGSEITRKMPPGHANAIFVEDANKLLKKQPRAVFEEAKRQRAFIFWNHPHWTAQRPDGVARLDPVHTELIREGMLHGIEVGNDLTYSDEALQIALDHNLTIIATSDVHGLVDWRYEVPAGGHRPVTLVFAAERSVQGIRDALFERRTVAYFEDALIGRADQLGLLLRASLTVTSAAYLEDSSVLAVQLENRSDAPLILRNTGKYRFHDQIGVLTVPAHGTLALEVKTGERLAQLELAFDVLNAVTAPGEHAAVTLAVRPTE